MNDSFSPRQFQGVQRDSVGVGENYYLSFCRREFSFPGSSSSHFILTKDFIKNLLEEETSKKNPSDLSMTNIWICAGALVRAFSIFGAEL